MPTLSSPWYQQKTQTGGPLTQQVSSQPPPEPTKRVPLSEEELEAMNERMSRPTVASRARQSLNWKLDGYLDRGRCAWTKMDLYRDCKKTMWTNSGTVKTSCQIRPLTVTMSRSATRLPQAAFSRPYTGLGR